MIPSYLHRKIIGPSGNSIKAIIDKFGGVEKVKINFPKTGSKTKDVITVTAHKNQIDGIRAALFSEVDSILGVEVGSGSGKVIEDKVEVPVADVSRIVGRGGEVLKEIQANHKVGVFIEDSNSAIVKVHIYGRTEENILSAKTDILVLDKIID